MFPGADVFTLFLDRQKLPSALHKHKITTSILDKIPTARKMHRCSLPSYPLAVEMLDLSGYDLVITSDSGTNERSSDRFECDAYLLLSFSYALSLG